MPPLPPPALSLWGDTAGAPPHTAPLAQDTSCDVAIVGGGYAGLHAALTLAEAGLSTLILEAGDIASGGSGRNGGVVSAKFRRSYPDLARHHGLETARQMYDIAQGSVRHLEESLERLNLNDTGFRKSGALKCAHTAKALARIHDETAWIEHAFGSSAHRLLDAQELHQETGSDIFHGGVLQKDAGTIHPLRYLLGLAGAVAGQGIALHTRTPVQTLAEEPDGVILETPGGRVRAGQVLLATNAYSSLTRATDTVARCLVPFRSAIIATQPLPAELSQRILPSGRSYTETHRMMRWFRKHEGRVLFGGRGALGALESPAAFQRLEKAMRHTFPDLRGLKIDYRWSGYVALTLDGLPQAGSLSPRISYAAGFNGAGVAMSGYVGHQIARAMLGRPCALGLIHREEPRKLPFYALRSVAVRAATCGYELLDMLE